MSVNTQGLTQAEMDACNCILLNLMMLLDPITDDEEMRYMFLYERIWDTLAVSRRERAAARRQKVN